MNFFFTSLFSHPTFFFIVVLSVGLSVCIHEFCHAYAALKMGDPTAAQMGHLTLNPLKQMGWFSLIMLLMLGFCWGAVPVNPANLTRKGRIAVSLAGPGANLMLFAVGIIAGLIALRLCQWEGLFGVAITFAQINMVLFCINIMPVPGFDGGQVLMEFIPRSKLYASEVGKGFMIGAMLLLFYCVGYIFSYSEWATRKVFIFCWELLS